MGLRHLQDRAGNGSFGNRTIAQAMSRVETRQLNRDSLFLMAQVRVEGDAPEAEYRVKVRNLSSGGMMAEGKAKVARGSLVQVELRNIGWVDGTVAWKQDDRFGIAFAEEIDPKLARAMPVSKDLDEKSIRNIRPAIFMPGSTPPEKLRKI
jgi:hypothetical protein